jgi:hypothetical protein
MDMFLMFLLLKTEPCSLALLAAEMTELSRTFRSLLRATRHKDNEG